MKPEDIKDALRQGLKPLQSSKAVQARARLSRRSQGHSESLREQSEVFPTDTVQSLITAVVGMSMTSAIKDLADELARNYDLDPLDVHLRLHRYLMDEDEIKEASSSVTALIKRARLAAAEEEMASGEE